jgi:AraC-like DNA-binding protein
MSLSAMRVWGLALRKSNTVHVGFVLEGRVTLLPREGDPVTLEVGDACIITNWSAFDVTCEDGTRAVHVLVPESRLRERGVRVRTARFRLEGPRTLGDPLLAIALAVVEPTWDPTPTAVRVADRAVEDLVVGLLVESEDHDLDAQDLRAQLRRRSIEEIALRHRDPSLTPAGLAKQLGVSLRHLQRGFEHSGTTVAEVIARQRAESAAILLAAPGGAALTVVEVARTAGFSSAYELRSALRSRFGVLPTQLRSAADGKITPESEQFRAEDAAVEESSAIVS